MTHMERAEHKLQSMRFVTGLAVALPFFITILGLIGIWPMVPGFVVALLFGLYSLRTHGPIDSWWWMWPGPLIDTTSYKQQREAHQWVLNCTNMPVYFLSHNNIIKFRKKSDAALFKLTWS